MLRRRSTNQPIRVLLVSFEFPPDTGGIGTYTYEIAYGLAKRQFDVEVLTYRRFSSESQIDEFDRRQPFPIKILKNSRDLCAVQRAIQSFGPDVLVSFDLVGTLLCRPVAALYRIPIVTVGMGTEFRKCAKWKLAFKRLIYRSCSHVAFISHFTRDFASQNGFNVKRFSIIPPGGNEIIHHPDHSCPKLLEHMGILGKRLIITVGTLSTRKGQDIILLAMPSLLKTHPNLHYIMAGRDTTDGAFERLAQQLGIANSVTFAGATTTEQKVALYNAAEFTVVTSRTEGGNVEGYGIVVVEAALCRKTCIGTRGTGLQDAIIDGETGILIAPDNPEATSQAIELLLSNQELRKKLENCAYEHAIKNSTWNARAEAFSHLIQRVVQRERL